MINDNTEIIPKLIEKKILKSLINSNDDNIKPKIIKYSFMVYIKKYIFEHYIIIISIIFLSL